jgi:hypothetical protein
MATQYANGKIVTSGLVLALDAADRNSYVSGSTVWNDVSGNGNSGSLVNGLTFSNNSIVFDGVDDNVITTKNLGANPLPTHSISIWFKTSVASGYKIIGIENAQTGTGAGNYDRNIYVGTNGKLYYGVYSGGVVTITSSMSVIDNTWRNVTAVATGTNSIKMYINGVLNATGTGNGFSAYATSYIRIGSYVLSSWPNSNTGFFNGSISNIQIYDRALTDPEILQNYNAQKSRFNL